MAHLACNLHVVGLEQPFKFRTHVLPPTPFSPSSSFVRENVTSHIKLAEVERDQYASFVPEIISGTQSEGSGGRRKDRFSLLVSDEGESNWSDLVDEIHFLMMRL